MLCEGGPIHQTNLIRGHSQDLLWYCGNWPYVETLWVFSTAPRLSLAQLEPRSYHNLAHSLLDHLYIIQYHQPHHRFGRHLVQCKEMWDLRSTKGSGPISILMMTVMILRKLLDYLKSQLLFFKMRMKTFLKSWEKSSIWCMPPAHAPRRGQTASATPPAWPLDTPLPSPASPLLREWAGERGHLFLVLTLTAAGAQ